MQPALWLHRTGLRLQRKLSFSPYFVIVGAVFDFFDGMVARLLKVQSPLGKELDSMADLVTFGVVPGAIVFKLIWLHLAWNAGDSALQGLILEQVNQGAYDATNFSFSQFYGPDQIQFYLPFAGFIITALSALRLAKFNLDTRQSDSFIGLPTPANTLLFASLPLLINASIPTTIKGEIGPFDAFSAIIAHPYFLIGLSVVMSFLLVAELPLLALKFKSLSWKANKVRYIFLLAVVGSVTFALLINFLFISIPIILLLYLLISIGNNVLSSSNEIQS